MAKDKKDNLYTGIIEKDEQGNYFCGPYLLDYQQVSINFNLGDKINIKTIIENPSDKSYEQYNKKSKSFFPAEKSTFIRPEGEKDKE